MVVFPCLAGKLAESTHFLAVLALGPRRLYFVRRSPLLSHGRLGAKDSSHWSVLRDLFHVLKSDVLQQGQTAGDIGEPEAGGIVTGILGRTALDTKGVKFGHRLVTRVIAGSSLHENRAGAYRNDLLQR